MHKTNIQNLDLNLLKTLHVLLEEENVSRAALRLSLSQSAVSHALGRLRNYFDDPLLIKVKNGMVPTTKADELKIPLAKIIDQVNELTDEGSFDPALETGTLKLAVSDYGAGLILPRLIEEMSHKAPNCRIECKSISQHLENDLKLGIIDLALGGYKAFDNFCSETIFKDRYIGAVRPGHPILEGEVTRQQMTAWPHVYISASRYSQLKDDIYRSLQITDSINIAATVPYFLVAPFIVEKSDLILIMPEMGARIMGQLITIELFELPLKEITFSYIQVWDRRRDNDKMHQWFRSQVREVCSKIENQPFGKD
jgi:DNA-binding transcriptional LysR family regulator